MLKSKSKLTHEEIASMGGKKRWSKISKKKRSRLMRELSFRRWKSNINLT